MNPPPSTPKRPRRVQPKIIGHNAPTPRVSGTLARGSLRAIGPASARPSVRPPAGAPGMRNFPRARVVVADRRGAAAVSVGKALREQAEAELVVRSAPEPELLPARPRRAHKPGPARPSVRGRPTVPEAGEEQPLKHAPAAGPAAIRPQDPPLRTAVVGPRGETPAPHRTRRRLELEQALRATERPRPSRVLAELHAALADEAASAE